mmetsp:Transcript_13836/g.41294  ORF Transcript_13836/g.41294 Transcript_13836/m.41294 type:complete len:340 (-) Transcript_13836:100-1119(-)|eukprot:CAMPEP_0175231954 /NCGR_PEP_ID=MMETSP0093-20121207/25720_1 /TAXON_ID=311494 /ORGANISM="Alexandrium monilatum, Strain CCMP3105" /LENGTH=339 /DNA_ID=CAMNT_0016525817 /DNA_START=51 /DNA_END=1070 /DNA_ORIENTATION=+
MTVAVNANDWLEIEKQLAKQEIELLKKEGVTVPEGHLDGYKYQPVTKIVDKQSWETLPMPNRIPKCTSANWSYTDVNFELGEGIAYLTLNRPDANNALNSGISEALHDATFELHRRKDIRIVVLRAEGKMFCAGGDPKSFADAAAMSEAETRKQAIGFMKFLYFFQCLPQFIVGLAQGSAMGSGIGLLAACDIVVAVSSARFTVSEVKLGTCPATIAPFLARKVGAAFAKRMLCTADNVSAMDAKRMGLVTDVVDDEMDFSKYVESVCDKVTLCAPIAASRAKRLVTNVSQRPLSLKLLEYTGSELADIRIGEEAIKGMVAVQAKTKPYWAETTIKPLY